MRSHTPAWRPVITILALLLSSPLISAQDAPQPQTVADPEVNIKELELLLSPLPKTQLLAEANGWQLLLQSKAEQIAQFEIAIRRENQEIKQAEEAGELAEEAKEQLVEAEEALAQPQDVVAGGGQEAAEKATAKANESIAQLNEVTATGSAGTAAKVLQDEGASIEEKSEVLESAAKMETKEAEAKQETRVSLLEQVTVLREERSALVDRLRTVLDQLDRKTDEADADTQAKISDLHLYAKAFSGIKVDVEDTTSAWIAVKGWLLSDEGGKRMALNLAQFLAILFASWVISRMFSSGVRHALARLDGTSRLLENFLVKAVRWIIMAIGLIMALSALEVSIGPLLAVVGAAGFVVAFALQDSLSNFASGLMMLLFRPFDEGDVIDAGGVSGKVQSLNLVSTTIITFDNKRMVVPNNKIWNDVITNATAVSERRVDMEFGIGYDDDGDQAQEILLEIISAHPKVLAEPEPTVRLHTLADSSVNFIARPWAKTADYWDVYWDVTKSVKHRFDKEGIGIPYPQQDVHLYIKGDNSQAALASPPKASPPQAASKDAKVRDDGGLDDPDAQGDA